MLPPNLILRTNLAWQHSRFAAQKEHRRWSSEESKSSYITDLQYKNNIGDLVCFQQFYLGLIWRRCIVRGIQLSETSQDHLTFQCCTNYLGVINQRSYEVQNVSIGGSLRRAETWCQWEAARNEWNDWQTNIHSYTTKGYASIPNSLLHFIPLFQTHLVCILNHYIRERKFLHVH